MAARSAVVLHGEFGGELASGLVEAGVACEAHRGACRASGLARRAVWAMMRTVCWIRASVGRPRLDDLTERGEGLGLVAQQQVHVGDVGQVVGSERPTKAICASRAGKAVVLRAAWARAVSSGVGCEVGSDDDADGGFQARVAHLRLPQMRADPAAPARSGEQERS